MLYRTRVVFSEQLHAHHGEYEYDYAQHERQVTEGADSSAHYRYQKIQRGPRFRQFEYSKL